MDGTMARKRHKQEIVAKLRQVDSRLQVDAVVHVPATSGGRRSDRRVQLDCGRCDASRAGPGQFGSEASSPVLAAACASPLTNE